MASADYTFWLGREAEQQTPMRVWADERGCVAEAVGRTIRQEVHRTVRGSSRFRLG